MLDVLSPSSTIDPPDPAKVFFKAKEVRASSRVHMVRKSQDFRFLKSGKTHFWEKSGKLGKGQEKVRIFIFEITFLNFETQLATVHINSSAIYLAVT